jgi:uncharacterized membrane protein
VTGGVERVLRWVFIFALAIAAPLLLAGLLTHSSRLLEAGVLTVMVTPLVGVVIVTVAMAHARDWPFTGVALLVLAILASSLYAATRMPPPTRAPGRAAPARAS